uniref:Uncharacterized protein n=1 Tax=Oryza nivara TaxID=4536 RepID=A0A0E0HWA1_ORYNI
MLTTDDKDRHGKTYESKPWPCMRVTMLNFSSDGANSGSGASPSSGLCPQVTSRRNTPKANMSVAGDALPVNTSSGARSQGDTNLLGITIIIKPNLHCLMDDKSKVPEDATPVFIETSIVCIQGLHAVDIDPYMVVIHVLELLVLEGVELDGEQIVASIAIVLMDVSIAILILALNLLQHYHSQLGGFCPHVISRANMPKENTSASGVTLPVNAISGAKFGHGKRSHGHVDPSSFSVIINPHLYSLHGCKGQVFEPSTLFIVSSRVGLQRGEIIDIDPNMIIIHVPKLCVLNGVELNCKDVASIIAIGLTIEEPKAR